MYIHFCCLYLAGSDANFSFSDVYDPVTFGGARFCEARVWTFFNHITTGMEKYVDYAEGKNLKNRMPLWVKPSHKLSVNDTMNRLRDHYENTPLDFRFDIGAGAYNAPYRWRPLTWDYKQSQYFNERAIATPQTGFTFVSQLRSWLPAPIGGIIWFGVDDSAMSVRIPIYCGVTNVPGSWATGNGGLMDFSFDSAFWVFNLVSNYAYSRYYEIYPVVEEKIVQLQNQFYIEVASIDKQAKEAYDAGDSKKALSIITEYSRQTGNLVVQEWLQFFKQLFVTFVDGYIKTGGPRPNVANPGYSEAWRGQIVHETGDHYKLPNHDNLNARKLNVLLKN